MTNTPAIKHPLYVDYNPNDTVLETVTLCRDCAKHPSLKRFVEENAVEGLVQQQHRRRPKPLRLQTRVVR